MQSSSSSLVQLIVAGLLLTIYLRKGMHVLQTARNVFHSKITSLTRPNPSYTLTRGHLHIHKDTTKKEIIVK